MFPAQRRQLILQLLGRHQQLGVNELAAELSASRETIRRDLAVLDAKHLLRRVHGGAVPAQMASEEAFQRRRLQQRLEKEKIGVCAASLFASGDSLLIDAGTTTVAFAQVLADKSGLTVITNSVEVAARMWAGRGENHVQLLGGRYHGEVSETLGPETVQQIGRFRADHAVLTVGTVDAGGGFMDYSMEEAVVATAMLEAARTVTVLADSSKLDRTALVRVCRLDQITRLVTESPPSPSLKDALDRAGVEVVVAL